MLVACAILFHAGKTFVAQRSASMHPPLKWEFPGGKLETGESPAACIARELQEEFSIEVEPIFQAPEFPFPNAAQPQLTLLPFVCKLISGKPQPTEHADFRWLETHDLDHLDWAKADLPVLSWWKAHHHQF